jgi:hypothetical protein
MGTCHLFPPFSGVAGLCRLDCVVHRVTILPLSIPPSPAQLHSADTHTEPDNDNLESLSLAIKPLLCSLPFISSGDQPLLISLPSISSWDQPLLISLPLGINLSVEGRTYFEVIQTLNS